MTRKCIPAEEIRDIVKRLEMTYAGEKGLVPIGLPITLLNHALDMKIVPEKKKKESSE